MCGVAGIIALNQDLTPSDFETVQQMALRVTHRGPSQQGFFENPRCMLGNTRLSIIDRSNNSSLPLSNREGSVWICYNGEVSNFKELRERYRLTSKYDFRGHSDTEVLVYLYQELGIDFLKELSGMFAFCLLDLRKRKAFIVRDFYGINPMFYMEKNGKLYFGSELKLFHEIPEFDDAINYEAMFHYFSLAYIPGNRTPYKDIEEMRGGKYMEIDLETGRRQMHTYYQLNYTQDHTLTEKAAVERTHDLLLDSVRRNLISDAPLGMTLSGGVDTSTILGLVKELGRSQEMHTFSLKMGESSFDESEYQHLMAKFANTIHHEIVVNPEDVIEVLVQHIAYIDEPNGDGSALPSFLLTREATKTVDVLLSGEGGDEIFNAYPTYGAYQVRKMYRRFVPKFMRNLIHWGVHKLPSDYRKLSFEFQAKRFTEGAELDVPQAHLYWRHTLTDYEKTLLMPTHHHLYRDSGSLFADVFNEQNFDDDLNRLSYLDIKRFFIDDLMVKNDRMFMAHSVEGRFPLMDRLLVDFVSTIPANLRIKNFKRRYIQKRAMEGLVPKEILKRSGFGLEMPHSIWFLSSGLGKFAEKYINKKWIDRTEFLDWKGVEQLWKAHKAGRKDYGRAVWCILLYMIWFDLFIYNKSFRKHLYQHPTNIMMKTASSAGVY